MNKQILDKSFKPYLTSTDLDAAIQKMADQLNNDYVDKNPLFIAILNGSFIFAADLFKKITIPAEISFIKLASYKGTKSTGNVVTAIGLETDLYDRHVVVLEDIIDTGKTLSEFLPQLSHQQPKSLKVCTLLHKKEATKHPINIDYLGFEIPDLFVVGYGLDYNGFGRNLDQIMQIDEKLTTS
jgi:hypoxanthine phosphoribosyltransferase